VEAQAKPATACGTLEKFRFEEFALPARDYYVYVPCGLKKKTRPPLVVYLHGCTQTAAQAATQTRWNALADAHGIVIAYPEQFSPNSEPVGEQQVRDHVFDGNGASCWNWFRPEHIQRGPGEAGTIAGITQRVMEQHAIDLRRVYVMGISAGGAMAGAMAANYPDLFAAAALLAGEAYPLGSDASGALAARAMDANAHPMPVMIVQGSLDELVPIPSGEANLSQWLGTNDLVDDGSANNSVPRAPASREDHGLDESAAGGVGQPGDICTDKRQGSPCPGGALGFASYPYSIEHYVDASGAPLVDYWLIHGLMHNYVGGDPSVPFSDPLGPDITSAAWEFFAAHARAP
jgi:poly(hydroxyalkanoate) depolymerase family esterase